MSILSVKNLSKSFGKLEVLNDISFNVEQGEVISIIGPSGSGKSTLLRCINQFEKIDSGECEICGITMTRNDENGKAVYADNKTLHDIRLKIGLVFQNFNLFPQYTALQNITLAGELLAVIMTLGTLSFLVTTPEVWVPDLGSGEYGFPLLSGAGRLVIKDTAILAGAVVLLSDTARKLLVRQREA